MTIHGWTPESITQLEKFLGDEGLALGRHYQKLYAEEYYSINDVFKRLFHVNLPQIKNYAPAVFDVFGGKETAMMPDAPEGMSGLNPGSLISRRAHGEKPKQLGASDVYLMHTYQMEHWKAWADTVKRLRGIFMGREVRTAIQQYYGKEAYSNIIEKINHFSDGGNRHVQNYQLVDLVRKGFTESKLGFNPGIFIKQLTSLPAYGMDMPISALVKGSADFWLDPVGNSKFLIESSDYIKNRWGEGFDRDVMRLLRDTAKKPNIFNRVIELSMISGKAGDIIPILIGGHSVYQYHYKKMVREGVHPDKAHKEAMLEFEMTTERTQQAGNIKDLGLYQSGGSLSRLFTMFLTSPRQYAQQEIESLDDAFAGKKGTKSRAAKIFLINHFVLAPFFQLASDAMRDLFDDDFEYDATDYIRAMIVGPLNGYFIGGGIVYDIFDSLLTGKYYGTSDSATAFSDRKYLTRAAKDLNKMVTKGDLTIESVLDVADDIAVGVAPVSPPTALYSIFRREKQRFEKMFKPKKNKYE